MKNKIMLNNKTVYYDFYYKKVKNINLRIKSDCTITVSANRCVSIKTIEEFMISKSDYILNVLEKYEKAKNKPLEKYFDESEVKELILKLCEKAFVNFQARGVEYPIIKFRRMVSRWGSCNVSKNTLTFNLNLMYAPYECIEYVVLHEFTHFIQQNHSKMFYYELSKVCPEWKLLKNRLKDISIR